VLTAASLFHDNICNEIEGSHLLMGHAAIRQRKWAMWSKSQRVMPYLFVLVLGLTLLSAGATPFSAGPLPMPRPQTPAAQTAPTRPAAKRQRPAHFDHNPKHAGIFFMSMDYKHHLEGVLLPGGTFRIYLYDAHTQPLKAEQTRLAGGTVQIGDSENAPKIKLAPGKIAEALEANLGNGLKFPVALTVLLRLPGMSATSRPELFNFIFKEFTQEPQPAACTPAANMPNMHC